LARPLFVPLNSFQFLPQIKENIGEYQYSTLLSIVYKHIFVYCKFAVIVVKYSAHYILLPVFWMNIITSAGVIPGIVTWHETLSELADAVCIRCFNQIHVNTW